MRILVYVEARTGLVLAALAVLFLLAVLLRLLTPAAFIAMLFGGIVMWRYGHSPDSAVGADDDTAAAVPARS